MPKHLTPMKAIRKKCVDDCCIGQRKEVKNCPNDKCPLHDYRMGKRPAMEGVNK